MQIEKEVRSVLGADLLIQAWLRQGVKMSIRLPLNDDKTEIHKELDYMINSGATKIEIERIPVYA